MLRSLVTSVFLIGAAGVASAQIAVQKVAPLAEALGVPELVEIMRDEGVDYAVTLETDMFPGQGGARWTAMVGDIYNPERMEALVTSRLAEELPEDDLTALTEFFTSEHGKRIIDLELTARRALLDDDVEATSREVWQAQQGAATPRSEAIEKFVAINSLIETNVVGALNSNYAFYVGLADGGAFTGTLTEDQMLADVWAQEPDIRSETTLWIYSYLNMAYQPLSDDDLAAYIAFSESGAGQALNTALFAAFDTLFTQVSRDLGLAASQFMAGEDI